MATNGIEVAAEHWLGEETYRAQKLERATALRTPAESAPEVEPERPRGVAREAGAELALAPLVDKIAYGLARGLVVAMKELENHIAHETRNVGEAVGRRLDTLQASFQDLTDVVSEQRTASQAVQAKCEQLAAATESLQESDARQAADLAGLRNETKELTTSVTTRIDELAKDLTAEKQQTGARLEMLGGNLQDVAAGLSEQKSITLGIQEKLAEATTSLRESDAHQAAELAALREEHKGFSFSVSERIEHVCKELGVQQEDLTAVKSALGGFSSRIDTVVERLDRQAEALRSMYTTYSQRESELEQLVDGLARLRAYPTAPPANRL